MTNSFTCIAKPGFRQEKYIYKFILQVLIFISVFISAEYVVSAGTVSDIVVTKVEYRVIKDGSIKAVISLSKLPKIKYKSLRKQNIVYIDLYKTTLSKAVRRKILVSPKNFLKDILSAQNTSDKVRVVFHLAESVDYRVKKISNPFRVEVVLNSKKKKPSEPSEGKRVSSSDSEGAISRARIMDEAQMAFDSGKFGIAIQLYEEILKLPKNSYTREAMELLALATEKLGSPSKARGLYKRYLRLFPAAEGADRIRKRLKSLEKEAARLRRVFKDAIRAFDAGRYDTAIKLFSELSGYGYKSRAALELLGEAYEKDGQIESAIDASSRYLKFYPDGEGAVRVRARLKALWELDSRSEKKFKEAGRALTGGEYERSARLYKTLVKDRKYGVKALEFLGLSYEKSGDERRAASTYEEYLKLYPKVEGRDRVAQRLAGLKTARSVVKKKLKKVRKRRDLSEYYGSFSQSYDSYTDLGDVKHITSSSLTTNINYNYRGRNDLYDTRSVFAGGYEHDFIDSGDSDFRLRRFYIDIKNKKKRVSMKVGRQQSSSGGVFSRFDGGIFGLRLNNELKLNVVTGLPMDSTKLDPYETRKYFLGVNLDIGAIKERWDFNTFVINQMVDGIIDRQGIGAEVRYFYERKSVFGYFDYDLFFDELNVFLLSGNMTFAGNTIINFSLDYKKSPLLTTSNATNGTNAASPADLSGIIGSSELHKRARDLTPTNRSLTLGFTHPLNEKLQVSGDLTVSNLTGTRGVPGPALPDGIGVEGSEGTGNDFFYNLQFIGNSFIMKNDIAIFGMRFSDTSTTDTYSILLNTRFPYTRNFKINPRMRLDYRVRSNEERVRLLPTIRLNYRWKKTVWFDLDSGIDWDKSLTDSADSTTSYQINLGYRYEF